MTGRWYNLRICVNKIFEYFYRTKKLLIYGLFYIFSKIEVETFQCQCRVISRLVLNLSIYGNCVIEFLFTSCFCNVFSNKNQRRFPLATFGLEEWSMQNSDEKCSIQKITRQWYIHHRRGNVMEVGFFFVVHSVPRIVALVRAGHFLSLAHAQLHPHTQSHGYVHSHVQDAFSMFVP